MEVANEKEFVECMEKHHTNYIEFATSVVNLIKQIAVGGPREHPQREDILSMLLSNLFAYSFSYKEHSVIPTIPASHIDFQKQYKNQLDVLSDSLMNWMFENMGKSLLKVPSLTERILHFCKLKTRIENADLEINQ
jgi:hypothetical protein